MQKSTIKRADISNLNFLKSHFDFPTYPQDKIREVKIVMIRLKPYNNECDITFKIPRNGTRTIYQIIEEQIDSNSSIINSLVVREIELSISFDSLKGEKTNSLSVKLNSSSGRCDIKSANDEVILIITKYLQYWKIVNEYHN